MTYANDNRTNRNHSTLTLDDSSYDDGCSNRNQRGQLAKGSTVCGRNTILNLRSISIRISRRTRWEGAIIGWVSADKRAITAFLNIRSTHNVFVLVHGRVVLKRLKFVIIVREKIFRVLIIAVVGCHQGTLPKREF